MSDLSKVNSSNAPSIRIFTSYLPIDLPRSFEKSMPRCIVLTDDENTEILLNHTNKETRDLRFA